MKKQLALTIFLICAAPAYAFAADADAADSRIKALLYDESDVYTITTKYGYQTNVIFSPQEEIQTISVGDRSLWQIVPSGNRLFIRPMEDDITTNMTVLTNKHSYYFDLKSVADEEETGNIYVAKFIYRDDKRAAPVIAPAQMTAPMQAPAAEPVRIPTPAPAADTAPMRPPVSPPAGWSGSAQQVFPNYNYTFAGPDDLAPLQVFDDGKSTFIKFEDTSRPLPDVFVVESGGRMVPMNYYVKGKFMVVETVAGELLLKSGSGIIHVYNETLNPK